RLALSGRRALLRLAALRPPRRAVPAPALASEPLALGTLGGPFLGGAWRACRSGRLRALALAALLWREDLPGLLRVRRRLGLACLLEPLHEVVIVEGVDL